MKCICNEYDLYGTIGFGPAENLPELIRNYQNCKMKIHENPMRVKDQYMCLLNIKDFACLQVCIDHHFIHLESHLGLILGEGEYQWLRKLYET